MAEASVRGGTSDALGIVNVHACVATSNATFTGWSCATALGLTLATLFARLGGALIFDWGGRSQEDAGAFRAGKGAVLVVVIVVAPRHIVWDQVPAIVRFVLGGLEKGWADGRGNGADRRYGGTTRTVDFSGMLETWGKIERVDGEVGGELGAVVLNLEGERGERDREGHLFGS